MRPTEEDSTWRRRPPPRQTRTSDHEELADRGEREKPMSSATGTASVAHGDATRPIPVITSVNATAYALARSGSFLTQVEEAPVVNHVGDRVAR